MFIREIKMQKRRVKLALVLLLACIPMAGGFAAVSVAAQDIPVNGTVTMVDLGAKTCIPCKMMAPILEELKVEYQGRAAVIFIDVREDPGQGKRFGVLSIPTQIFYDRNGREIFRHAGFYSKEKIKLWLDTLLEREDS